MSDDLLLYGNRIIMPDIMKTRDLERYTNGTKEFRNADYQLKTQRGGQAYQRIWTTLSADIRNARSMQFYRENH